MQEESQTGTFERDNVIAGAAFAFGNAAKLALFAELPASPRHIFITDVTHADITALTVQDNTVLLNAFETMCEMNCAVEEGSAMIYAGVEGETQTIYRVRVFCLASKIGVGIMEDAGSITMVAMSPEEALLHDIFGDDNPFAAMQGSLNTPQA